MLLDRLKKSLVVAFVLFSGVFPALVFGAEDLDDFEGNRASLIAYILREQLSLFHFSHKPIDDDLSLAAFDLYLEELDSGKKFLLEADVERLKSYARQIDDEVNSGTIKLPRVSAQILKKRIAVVRKMVGERAFDFSKKEDFETDPENLDFCKTDAELKERWRKIIKHEALLGMLDLLEDGEKVAEALDSNSAAGGKVLKDLQKKSLNAVLKRYEKIFLRMTSETDRDYYNRYFNAFAKAFDPHTNYLPPAKKEEFDISMRGSLEGIGAMLRENAGYIEVTDIVPGSAAYYQGQLEDHDVVLAVAEGDGEPVEVAGMRIHEAVNLIRGKGGTEVRLTVRKPDGRRLIIPITRNVIEIEETFVKSTVLKDEKSGKKYGYIQIPTFYRDFETLEKGGSGRNVTDDVKAELAKLKSQNIQGLIIDMRNNVGGALTDAIAITGLFIKYGPVMQVRGSDGRVDVLSDQDPKVYYTGPLVTLVNESSASAAEIMAGAFQDYQRGIVIGGEHTNGKGTVQALMDLDSNIPFQYLEKYKPLGALKVTVQKFYRVSGDSTQYRGVIPDVILPTKLQHLESGEQYIEHSLPWDTVDESKYQKWLEDFDLEPLKAKSRQRVEANPEFLSIKKEAEYAKRKTGETLQSLYWDDVLRERQEGKKFNSFAGEQTKKTKEKDKSLSLSKEEKRKLWLEEVSEDIYIDEAMCLFADMPSMSDELPVEDKLKTIEDDDKEERIEEQNWDLF